MWGDEDSDLLARTWPLNATSAAAYAAKPRESRARCQQVARLISMDVSAVRAVRAAATAVPPAASIRFALPERTCGGSDAR